MSNDVMVELAADIVSAYVSKNSLPHAEVPEFIRNIYTALSNLGSISTPVAASTPIEKAAPAVSVNKSVTHDHIVCLEDGLIFKSLRRHLTTHHKLTADEYRTKWGLPRGYPMVAPSYSVQRSELAKTMGLGRKSGLKKKPKSK